MEIEYGFYTDRPMLDPGIENDLIEVNVLAPW